MSFFWRARLRPSRLLHSLFFAEGFALSNPFREGTFTLRRAVESERDPPIFVGSASADRLLFSVTRAASTPEHGPFLQFPGASEGRGERPGRIPPALPRCGAPAKAPRRSSRARER